MDFLKNVRLIQGGMGVYVSHWRLAQAVARERPGTAVGTVSGTGLDVVYVRLLQLGDPGGHVRSAMHALDQQYGVTIGKKIVDQYFIEGGKEPDAKFRNAPQHIVRPENGGNTIPAPGENKASTPLYLDEAVTELLIATGFAEVWLAKQGHQGKIFMNFLKKVELPLIYTLYGAMLAGVDGVIVGAGNPDGLPADRTLLTQHQTVSTSLQVLYREAGESFHVPFDPHLVADGRLTEKPLRPPAFLAIVSLENLVQALAKSQTEAPDGFIIEHHTAGGHNAPPQGPLVKDSEGQPQYSAEDEPDLAAIRDAGLPFWMAGGYSNHAQYKQALAFGATGVQIGSNFALSQDSGLKPAYKSAILDEIKKGTADADLVKTTMFSPTGFPFKVAQLAGTLADESVYEDRMRVCDIGLLQQRGLSKPAEDGSRRLFMRCSAAPVNGFVSKRGLEFNTEERRCLCNGLLSTVGLGQIVKKNGGTEEEPAIVTLGNNLDGIRRLSRNGQAQYWAKDVIADILDDVRTSV
jgi:nitronate monooxygenase